MTVIPAKHPSKRSQFNAYNFLVCYLVSLGQVAFGYPASVIGVTLGVYMSCYHMAQGLQLRAYNLGEPPFYVYMGLVDAEGKPTHDAVALIGTMNGVFQVGTTNSSNDKPSCLSVTWFQT